MNLKQKGTHWNDKTITVPCVVYVFGVSPAFFVKYFDDFYAYTGKFFFCVRNE